MARWQGSGCVRAQRGWNTQPEGGLAGLGTSPSRMMRRRLRSVCGSGIGTAESSASVYGCCGKSYSTSLPAISTTLPRYITATRSRDVLDHRQVVGDEQIGQLELVLQVVQQVDDLRADGHVEGADRLVADDQARVERQRAGDADALALTAENSCG